MDVSETKVWLFGGELDNEPKMLSNTFMRGDILSMHKEPEFTPNMDITNISTVNIETENYLLDKIVIPTYPKKKLIIATAIGMTGYGVSAYIKQRCATYNHAFRDIRIKKGANAEWLRGVDNGYF